MKLRDARKRSGFSQVNLASLLGVNQSLISQWENNVTCPSAYYRQKIDDLLRVKVDWIEEFAPLDTVEGKALLRFAGYLYQEGDFGSAAELFFSPKVYEVRQLLKLKGFLPRDYKPESELGEKPLLPPGVKDEEED